jgi:Zn-dependent protease/predicted transcriptional regulator
MFGKRYRLFSVFGFQISLDASWFVLAFLVTWTLAVGYFPAVAPGFARNTYWVMGVTGALGLFGSIVLHELSHAVIAQRNDIPMKGITLFIFGGVAEMSAEPPSAGAEFRMAVAGPIASVVIGSVLYSISVFMGGALPAPAVEVVRYLGWLNLILAGFNLIPAFPLDGGRMLRAYLWHRRGNLTKATHTSSKVGSAFGFVLMALGVATFLAGGLVPGLWYFVLGMFLRGLARSSYQQVLLKEALEGEPVRRFMKSNPITVPSDISLRELVEDYVYRHHHKLYPVVDDGQLSGCVTVRQLRAVPREEWEERRVGDIAAGCNRENTIPADTDALEAMRIMRNTGSSRLLVTSNGRLEGVITLKDLLEFFALRVELEA